MIATENQYEKLFGLIMEHQTVMPKCACVACNSCTCACACRNNPDNNEAWWDE